MDVFVSMRIVLQILAIFSPLLCSGEETLPLIAWSNTRSLANTPRISAGKVVTREELGTNYMGSILQTQPQNILLFVFDELSIDDITRYSDAYNSNGQGGAFSHLKAAMMNSLSHLVLPSVEPSDLESDLGSKVNGGVIDLKEPSLDGVTLDQTKTNLVIVHFSMDSGDSKEEFFTQADEIIGSMVQRQRTPYTAILTARHKSKLEPKAQTGDRLTVGRRLLAEDEKTTFIAHYEKEDICNVYMIADSLSLVKDSHTTIVLSNKYSDWSTDGSNCTKPFGVDARNATLVLTLRSNSTEGLDNFTMTLDFTMSPFGQWYVLPTSYVEVGYSGLEKTFLKYNVSTGITPTPKIFSYHCSNTIFKLTSAKTSKSGTADIERAQLKISGFQVQPFGVRKGASNGDYFGSANDCVGFFTEAIWMGLFMGLIIIMIISLGLGMILNLQVMDKFDDPKGKTISVNTAAD